ncbi:MAG: lipocalin family protein [Dysgonamonadaceae bacterium]|jgi:hypothetical protein|nr:lipocalin family protein [Dysgonamonadaceae bacterium]
MKKTLYFLVMLLAVTFSSCNKNDDDPDTTTGDGIPWGEIKGSLNDTWFFENQESFAESDNPLAQTLLPVLINMLNTTREAEAYVFNSDKTYSQYWTSDQPNDQETGLYKEDGTYTLSDRDLTLTYTENGETKTGEYQIVSLSDTQLVIYKDLLGIWGALATEIVAPFDKMGIRPKRAYQIITYTNVSKE